MLLRRYRATLEVQQPNVAQAVAQDEPMDLTKASVGKLKALCEQLGLADYEKLKKDELIALLEGDQ